MIFLQWTWGILQNIAGLFLFLLYLKRCHFYYNGAVITFWDVKEMSLGLGMFIFLSMDYLEDTQNCSAGEKQWPEGDELERIKVHEYGHTIQSVLLGPLFLPMIGFPSLLWASLPACVRYRRKRGVSYYSFYTERWANWLGELVTGEESVR